ncbi:MAG: DNA recombination protein RmuC [Deltaproteobacteria bacterium ADurb.Bin510]|nr:MAG: DNA recombination protein RmuC [Deltaproteobacteria bacterium ADurb.Bin510]
MEAIYGLGAGIIAILLLALLRTRSRAQLEARQNAELRSELQSSRSQLDELRVRAAELGAQLSERGARLDQLAAELSTARAAAENSQQQCGLRQARIGELEATLELERRQAAEKLALLNEARQQLSLEFNNLANRIFEEKSQKFTDQNRSNLEVVLNPLREQLGEFKKRVEDVYDKESKDRAALHGEITSLRELNRSIGQEALNLTKALKGESKTRGNWGEVVLERVLEESGLEKGREYEIQVSLTSSEGRRYQPDVIVRLPENKDVVIDAKVNLAAYERYSSSEDELERASALKEHINALRLHIKDLGSKNYEELPGIRSLDFVLLFVPIEAAFLAAMQQDAALFGEAYKERIVIVSPSTLLVTLKTIQFIWRGEYQNKNAQEIARQAAGLYDQFVGFVEALKEIEKHLDKSKEAYDKAYSRLASGRGNLMNRTQSLKKLGLNSKKDLTQLERAIEDEAE